MDQEAPSSALIPENRRKYRDLNLYWDTNTKANAINDIFTTALEA